MSNPIGFNLKLNPANEIHLFVLNVLRKPVDLNLTYLPDIFK